MSHAPRLAVNNEQHPPCLAVPQPATATISGRTRSVATHSGGRTPALGPPERLPEPLSQAETRILRFPLTSLCAPEIAREIYVSANTVRTHMRHLHDKLGAHRRLEALDRARALGLLE